MYHTLSAIAYCHSKGVIHKDLKPENVMMSTAKDARGYAPTSEMHVVVVDFGLAEVFSDPTDTSRIVSGTPPYMAPEVWAGNFNKSCDIWSCGVMLFFLLSGRLPFVAQKLEDFPRAIAYEPDWAMMGGASEDAHSLCRKMLIKNCNHRPSAPDVLRERWFLTLGLSGVQKVDKPLDKIHLNALLKVAERTEFEKFVSRLVATQVDASEQRQVNEAFRAFDLDGDGLLSREELRRGLRKMSKTDSKQVEEVIDAMDVGNTGRISYSEFLAGVINLRGNKKEDQDKLLWIAWQAFSPDEQGRVKIASVQESLAARGMTVVDVPESFLEEMKKGGKASDYLTFESFKKLFAEDKTFRNASGKLVDFVDNVTGGRAQDLTKRVQRWFSKK
jgi:calcium-dependent protein kinase